MLTSKLVQRIFSQVRTEFTEWNVAHCHQALTSFTASSTWQSCLHPDLRLPSLASIEAIPRSSSDIPPAAPEASSPAPLVFQEVYSPDGAVIESSSVKLEILHLSSSLEPYPPYESCSPLHRSVFKGDDSDNMDFIPYADDITFDQTSHTCHYGSLSWQDTSDPDLEVIVLETAYRLRTQYGLTYDEIEDCNVLPLRLHSRPGRPGLLSTVRRRDRLYWDGNTIPTSYTSPPQTWPEGSDFRNRLRKLNSLFCPNLNCVEPLCSVHGVQHYSPPNPMSPRSRLPLSHVLSEVTNPCRNQCFMNDKMNEVRPFPWDEADLDMFRVISEISPNTTSCDLAELCLKPCHEVFYYRKLLFSSEEIQPAIIRTQRRMLKFNDRDPMQFTPNNPCHHTGPCSSSSSCPCFENQSHCQRNCHCSPECNRRWQGCRCSRAKSRWNCVTEKCPCVEALRECDPELCTNCRCTCTVGSSDDTSCRNSQIQRGARKKLEVKRSSWGLGTFLAEAAKAGDLITEYVGEIIYEPTVESRADLATHRNRCYVFGLSKTFSLDATYAGNISRFIDHSDAGRSKRENSQARVQLVNGDHRIGIFAIRDMEADSQVLMNYGSLFFVE
ncbi:SET domain-containing protein [Imleria badia]|nr:SET domain-containing protein [Imleria badia]